VAMNMPPRISMLSFYHAMGRCTAPLPTSSWTT
jgi:hypothetical protein